MAVVHKFVKPEACPGGNSMNGLVPESPWKCKQGVNYKNRRDYNRQRRTIMVYTSVEVGSYSGEVKFIFDTQSPLMTKDHAYDGLCSHDCLRQARYMNLKIPEHLLELTHE